METMDYQIVIKANGSTRSLILPCCCGDNRDFVILFLRTRACFKNKFEITKVLDSEMNDAKFSVNEYTNEELQEAEHSIYSFGGCPSHFTKQKEMMDNYFIKYLFYNK